MKNRKNVVLTIVLLLLFGFTAKYVSDTYSKYTALSSGEGSATVAKWAFESDNSSMDFNINLQDGIDPSTLVENRIAPGTAGSFDIELSNANSEVGVNFTITFGGTENVPANLVFKQGNTTVNPSNGSITGTIAAGETLTVPMNWEWAYYTSDADDAEDNNDGISGNTMTLKATVSGVQVQPGTAVVTGIN